MKIFAYEARSNRGSATPAALISYTKVADGARVFTLQFPIPLYWDWERQDYYRTWAFGRKWFRLHLVWNTIFPKEEPFRYVAYTHVINPRYVVVNR